MSRMLDPWDDAGELADRLKLPGSRLLILLGAEAWCFRCRNIRPEFDSMATRALDNEVWLWLDVEDHVEFLNGYYPENLPLMLVYKEDCLESSTFIDCAATLDPCPYT